MERFCDRLNEAIEKAELTPAERMAKFDAGALAQE